MHTSRQVEAAYMPVTAWAGGGCVAQGDPRQACSSVENLSASDENKEKKMQELDQAPFGIVGLETSLGLVITRLVEPGHLDWPTAIRKMSLNPARILGINKGTLAIGADADVTVIDPKVRWTVDPSKFRSKSGNTPFAGWELTGRAEVVVVGGRIKFDIRRP
jgi:dihydroorotase